MNRRSFFGKVVGVALAAVGLKSAAEATEPDYSKVVVKGVPMKSSGIFSYQDGTLIEGWGPGRIITLPIGWEVKSITSSIHEPTVIEAGPMPAEEQLRILELYRDVYGNT